MKGLVRNWPWLATIAAVAFALSPLGREIYHSAFVSSDPLGREIAQFLLVVAALMTGGLMAAEILVKWLWRRRAGRGRAGGEVPPGIA
jgi:hypothetical protein